MASSPPESPWCPPPSPLVSMLFQPDSERPPEIVPHLEALRDEVRQMELVFEGNRDLFTLFFIRAMAPPGRAAPLLLKLLLLECLLGAATPLADSCVAADGVVVQAIGEAAEILEISNGQLGGDDGSDSSEVAAHGSTSSESTEAMETQSRKSRARVVFESLRSIDGALSALATLMNVVKFFGLVVSWLRGPPIPGPT
uniref:Uncharacterized protein n=1 Tax=Nelumbo nucifera TaxID=4432 RepID=A0A822YTN0_NELNU|nr:TPA_asm: hypothetical protein HUJ06_006642 [Nelumbo nucifera]